MMRRRLDETGRTPLAEVGMSLLFAGLLLVLGVLPAPAAPKAVSWSFWAANDPASRERVNHGSWQKACWINLYNALTVKVVLEGQRAVGLRWNH